MKKTTTILTLIPVLLALLVAGCTVDAPDSPVGLQAPEGTEIFANYVAIGNSLTSGYMDSGLMVAGQRNSYPMLIAQSLGLSSEEWMQPYILPPGIGTTNVGEGNVAGVLYFNGTSPVPLGITSSEPITNIYGLLQAMAWPTPYNNLGVPGARLHEVMATYSAATSFGAAGGSPNSFFDFINRASFFGNTSVPAIEGVSPAYETASMFSQAVAKGPTLLTAWIGANDVLYGAISGDPLNSLIITDPGTDPGEFAGDYGILMGSLAKGLIARTGFPATIVVGTIPKITNIPYFLSTGNLQAVYGPAAGAGAWTYEEDDVELVLLPNFLQWFMTYYLVGGELPASMTLSTAEITFLDDTVDAYNAAIVGTMAYVEAQGWAQTGVVDMNAELAALGDDQKLHFMYLRQRSFSGGIYEEVATTAARTYFSLDGVHPNNMGYAYVANVFMDEISSLTGTTLTNIPPAALTWDPTYAAYGGGIATKAATGPGTMSAEAVAGIQALFR